MRQHELFAVLAERIGPEKAEAAVSAIIANWGGEAQMIPNGTRTRRMLREEEVRRLFACGLSASAIAERVGISQRHVRRLIATAITPFPAQ